MRTRNSVSGSLLYIIAIILIATWAIAYFGYNARDMVHALVVFAVIIILFRLIRGNF
jgi:predicted ferric reductase